MVDIQHDTNRNTVEDSENILTRGYCERDTRGRLPWVLLEVGDLDPSLCTEEGGGEGNTEVDDTEAGCSEGAGLAVRDVSGEEAGQDEVHEDGGEEVHEAEVGHQHHGSLVPPPVKGFPDISLDRPGAQEEQQQDQAVEADAKDQDHIWGKYTCKKLIDSIITFPPVQCLPGGFSMVSEYPEEGRLLGDCFKWAQVLGWLRNHGKERNDWLHDCLVSGA